jgi:Glycosyltransferase Family 4
MNILLLAPQPFYSERGTPIAVDLVLKVLSERGYQVDVVTYHEGSEVKYDGVTLHRIVNIPFVRNIRPGLSWKKLICDCFVMLKATRLVSRNNYQFVHAVEESVFMALVLKWFFRVPYIYDMDSSLGQQMVERYPFLAYFEFVFNFFEKLAVQNAKAVAPVCEALAHLIQKYNPEKLVILQDVSLLKK